MERHVFFLNEIVGSKYRLIGHNWGLDTATNFGEGIQPTTPRRLLR